MNSQKEWIGFGSCLFILIAVTLAGLLISKERLHNLILESEYEVLSTELSIITEDIEFKLLEKDITLFDLGYPEITSTREELLEAVIIETLTAPNILQAFAYDLVGKPIELSTGTQQNSKAIEYINHTEKKWFHEGTNNDPFSFFLTIGFLEASCIMEIQFEKNFILNQWATIDRQILHQGILTILTGSIMLFIIFRFMSIRIQAREKQLENKNHLLEKTNQKLAQAYKTVSLGALTGHLMHALKTPLSQLQLIVGEARENKDINPKELEMIQIEIRDLVSQSLQSLQEIENQKKSYEISMREVFQSVIQRTHNLSASGKIKIEEHAALDEKIDNLQSTLLIPIIVNLVENAFQTKKESHVRIAINKKGALLSIIVSDTSGGIPENEQPFLFDPSKSRKKGGTGLGLALAKQLAQNANAELSLISSDKFGSKFSIALNIDP